MKKIISSLFFAIFSIQAEIIQTNRMDEILPYIDKNTWVIFDIDNTLLEPSIQAGRAEWFHYEIKQLMANRGIDREEAEEFFFPEWDRFMEICPIQTPEAETPALVAIMQQKSGASLALTARHPPLAKLTLRQLEKIKIDFSHSAPLCAFLETIHPTHWENGVLFASFMNSKGALLRQFIENSREKPKKIVFIDDTKRHLEEMEVELDKIGIGHVGFHYTKSSESPFDAEIAAKEYREITAQNRGERVIHESFVDSNGARLFCRSMGKGAPLIVIHGGPGLSQDYLLPSMYKLAENRFVIFYDQRGSGRSEGDADLIDSGVFVEDLDAIRKAFGFERVSILGHSWGGFLAMQYAISHPDALDKLVLMNSLPASSADFGLFLKEWVRRMAPQMSELEAIKKSQSYLAGDPETTANYLRIIFRKYCAMPEKADDLNLLASPSANIKGLKTSDLMRQRTLLKSFDLTNCLHNLTCKTLILHADQDPIPVSTAENIHNNIRGSEFVVIEECGHFPYVEKPEELFSQLNTFLRK